MFNSHQIEVAPFWQVFDNNGKLIQEELPKYSSCNIQEHLDIEISRPDGTIRMFKQVPFKSFVANFLDMLYCAFSGNMNTNPPTVKDITGTSVVAVDGFGSVNASAGNDTYGLLVGSNNGTIDLTDYKLDTKINHGVSPGSLEYGQVTFGQTSVWTSAGVTTGAQFKIERTFTNNTSNQSSVTVAEVGLVLASGVERILIARDRVSYDTSTALNEVVAYGEIIKVTYYFTISSDSKLNVNWIKILESIFAVRSVSLNTTTSTSPISITFGGTRLAQHKLSIAAAAGNSTYGIMVGSGTQTLDSNLGSSSLSQQILHSLAGMNYGVMQPVSYVTVGVDEGEIIFSRDIINVSTNTSFTLNELGLACDGNGINGRVLLSHLKIGPITITPNQFFRAYYKFRIKAL